VIAYGSSGVKGEIKKKSVFRLTTNPAQCVGCLLCQMRCTFRFIKAFGLTEARINIDWEEASCTYTIDFDDGCDSCGLCARYCVYGALTLERAGG